MSLYTVCSGRTDDPEPTERRFFSTLEKAETFFTRCINASEWPQHWIKNDIGVYIYRDYYIYVGSGSLPAIDDMDNLIQLW